MQLTQLQIGQLGPKGDGVHSGPRGNIYVERTVPGDRILAKLQRDPHGVVRGDIVEFLQPSRLRQDPPCRHFDVCGNCTLQHVQDRFYREWKGSTIREALSRYGLRPGEWLPPLFVGNSLRRRATFVAEKLGGKLTVGYFQRRSQAVGAITECLVVLPKILEVKAALEPWLRKCLPDQSGIYLFIQIVNDRADVVLTGDLPERALHELSRIEIPSVARISWRIDEDESPQVLFGPPPVISFGALQVKLPPAAFLQPTLEGERALVEAMLESLPPEGKFADLFSGCGTFAGHLLNRGPVDAFEMTPSSVSVLAKAAGGKPLRAFRRDLFRHPLSRAELNRYDAVVFDPPRGGSPEQAEALSDSKVGVIVGVSCNPATFARDAAILGEGGYRLQTVKLVDQFRWSHHVEVVGTFTRGKKYRRFQTEKPDPK